MLSDGNQGTGAIVIVECTSYDENTITESKEDDRPSDSLEHPRVE